MRYTSLQSGNLHSEPYLALKRRLLQFKNNSFASLSITTEDLILRMWSGDSLNVLGTYILWVASAYFACANNCEKLFPGLTAMFVLSKPPSHHKNYMHFVFILCCFPVPSSALESKTQSPNFFASNANVEHSRVTKKRKWNHFTRHKQN